MPTAAEMIDKVRPMLRAIAERVGGMSKETPREERIHRAWMIAVEELLKFEAVYPDFRPLPSVTEDLHALILAALADADSRV